MIDRKLFKNFDYTLAFIVLALIGIGFLMITSATNTVASEADKYSFLKKQIVSFVIGIVFLVGAMKVDYNVIGKYLWYIYGFNIFLLILVKIFGKEINGAKSWIQFGSFSMQPSEISKILIIIFVGKVLSDIRERGVDEISQFNNLAKVIGMIAVPLALIMLQPDFGTAMVIIAIISAMLFAANLNYKYFAAAAGFVAVMVPFAWFFLFKNYQKDRIRVFLNPDLDPLNKGFQVIQSKVAIGSGTFWGKGLFQGTQTQMGFLPFKETDFIFSVIGEELGFFWSMVILVLFGALLLKIVDIARNSKDFLGSMICIGVATMIGIHVFQNVGMTMGLMPVTGIPLPFISYGGSSLIANMFGIGLVLNVAMRRQKIAF